MRKDIKNLLNLIQGVHSLESIIARLEINRTKAIKLLSNLRKKGYVKTKRLSNNKRLYEISMENRLGGTSYIDVLNQNSPIKLRVLDIPRVYGKEISLEETLIFSIKSKSLRQILSALALFKKINNWPLLYNFAKQNNLQRQVCALYELSRTIIKTRKMTLRFYNLSLPKPDAKYIYLISGLSSKDFKSIEKKWKVYLPFNKEDLEDYK